MNISLLAISQYSWYFIVYKSIIFFKFIIYNNLLILYVMYALKYYYNYNYFRLYNNIIKFIGNKLISYNILRNNLILFIYL